MKNIKNIIFYTVCVFVLLVSCVWVLVATPKYKVFAAIDESFVGDKDQILGICNALCALNSKVEVTTIPVTDSEAVAANVCNEIESALCKSGSVSKTRFILLSSGNYGVTLIKYLKTKKTNLKQIVTCYTTHQITSRSAELVGFADLMAIPNHAIEPQFEEKIKNSTTNLVATIGVTHNTSEEMILSAYEKAKDQIKVNPPYLVVVLGGDAPQPNGNMRFYSSQEAEKLADLIANKAKSEHLGILVLNGPRTGKFDSNTGKLSLGVHENGFIDAVTSSFIKTLERQNLVDGIDFKLFDFQFKQPSMKMAVYGALKKFSGKMFVAGESTSMVSEATSLFDPSQVVIFKNGAMNENHLKHAQSEYENNRASILNEDMSFDMIKDKSMTRLHESVATSVAKVILKKY